MDYVRFYLQSVTYKCGLPAGTVKLTLPALTTCDGAISKVLSIKL